MKSIRRQGLGGNIKLHGKISKTLSCGCCDVFNFKNSERWKEAANEIKYLESDSSQVDSGDNDNDSEPERSVLSA